MPAVQVRQVEYVFASNNENKKWRKGLPKTGREAVESKKQSKQHQERIRLARKSDKCGFESYVQRGARLLRRPGSWPTTLVFARVQRL